MLQVRAGHMPDPIYSAADFARRRDAFRHARRPLDRIVTAVLIAWGAACLALVLLASRWHIGAASKRVFRFPDERDPVSLYDLHRRLVARAGAARIVPRQPRLEDAVAEIQRSAAGDFAFQVEAGDYEPDFPAGYRLTWQGVIRAMTRLGLGFKAVRQRQGRRRATALAAELRTGVVPDVKVPASEALEKAGARTREAQGNGPAR